VSLAHDTSHAVASSIFDNDDFARGTSHGVSFANHTLKKIKNYNREIKNVQFLVIGRLLMPFDLR